MQPALLQNKLIQGPLAAVKCWKYWTTSFEKGQSQAKSEAGTQIFETKHVFFRKPIFRPTECAKEPTTRELLNQTKQYDSNFPIRPSLEL